MRRCTENTSPSPVRMILELSELTRYLGSIGLPPGYTIRADNDKGSDIPGFDQLTIDWNDQQVEKSIQIVPEVSDMKIKRWQLAICAWMDDGERRHFWKETLIIKKRKSDLVAIAFEENEERARKT